MTIKKWQTVEDPSKKWKQRIRADIVAESKSDIDKLMENYEYPFGAIFKSNTEGYDYSFFIYEGHDKDGVVLEKVLSGQPIEKKPARPKEEPQQEKEAMPSLEEPEEEPKQKKEEMASLEEAGEEDDKIKEQAEKDLSGIETISQKPDVKEKAAVKEEKPEKFKIQRFGESDSEEPKEPEKTEEKSQPEVKEEKPEKKTSEENTLEKAASESKESGAIEEEREDLKLIKLGVIYQQDAENVKEPSEDNADDNPVKKIYEVFIEKINGMVSKQNINVNFEINYKLAYDGVPDKPEVLEKQKDAEVLIIIDRKENLSKLENVFKKDNIKVYTFPVKDINKDYEYLNLAADIALRA